MNSTERRRKLPSSHFGKLGLACSLLALGFAWIPAATRPEKTGVARWIEEATASAETWDRHLRKDSRFELRFDGERKWTSLALLAAVAGLVLGLVSLGEERIAGLLAALLGAAVAAWQYTGFGPGS
jgi:hypothetical protein